MVSTIPSVKQNEKLRTKIKKCLPKDMLLKSKKYVSVCVMVESPKKINYKRIILLKQRKDYNKWGSTCPPK